MALAANKNGWPRTIQLGLPVVQIDVIHNDWRAFVGGDNGIDGGSAKRPLGLIESTTENTAIIGH